MDGVIYRTDAPIPGAVDAINDLRTKYKKKVAFLTNNSTKTREDFSKRLNSMGIEATPDEIFTSGSITADALKEEYPNATVFVVGEGGLGTELKNAGFTIVNEKGPEIENLKILPKDLTADLVVMGMDTHLTYNKMRVAMMFINDRNAKYIVTNEDYNFPAPGTLWPGAGAQVAFLNRALGRKPDIIYGKPYPEGILNVLKHYGFKPEESVLIGDRFNTDILGGNNAGMTTVCVETGINNREELKITPKEEHPTFMLKDLIEMMDLLK